MKTRPGRSIALILNSLVVTGMLLSLSAEAATNPTSWSALCAEGDSAIAAQTPTVAEQRYRQAVALVKKQSKDQGEIDKCLLKLASALTLLDRTAEARTILQEMLQRLEKKHGGGSSKLSAVLMGLGSIEESAGDHSLAMNYYNRALQISEKNYGVYSPDAAIALHGIGRVHNKMGNRTAANDSYKRAITILSREPNLEAADQLKSVMHDYGDLMKGTDQSDRDLIDDFQKDIFNKTNTDATPPNDKNSSPKGSSTFPDRSTSSSSSSTSLSSGARISAPYSDPPGLSSKNSTSTTTSQWQQQTEQQLAKSRSADTNENELVSLRGIHLPASDAALKPAFKVMSDTIFDQSRYHMGEAQYKRMIAADVDSLGPNHPSVANDFNGLAQLYIAQKNYTEARQCLVRALAIYESTYQSRNVLTINTVASLASVEANLGHVAEATRLYREALSNAQEALGPNSLETAKILNGLAFLYYQQGQLDKASTFYEWAIASTEHAVGTRDPLLAACLKDYAQVLRGLDKNSKASEIEQRAGQILSQ